MSFSVSAATQMMKLVTESWTDGDDTLVGYDGEAGHGSLAPNGFTLKYYVGRVMLTKYLPVKTFYTSGTATVIQFSTNAPATVTSIKLTIDGTTFTFGLISGSNNMKYSAQCVLTEGTHIITV